MVGRGVVVCGPPHGGAWCGASWPPAWWGMLSLCLPPLLGGVWRGGVWSSACYRRGVVARGPSWAGRGVVVCGTPHGGACCVGVWPHSWWGCGVLCCVVPRCGMLCCVALRCAAWCGGLWPPSLWGVLCWCVALRMVGRAALRCGVLCCSALCVVVVCDPPHGGACCGGVWPASCWGYVMLCCVVVRCGVFCCVVVHCVVWWWYVAPLMVGRAALVCGPPVRWGVLCWDAVCCIMWHRVWGGVWPPHGGAACVGVWLPSWWGMVCCVVLLCVAVCCVALRCVVRWWCVAPLMVGCAALGCRGLCCVALCVVVVCGPCMVGRPALVYGPPLGWACCVGPAVCCFVWCCVVCGGVWPPICRGVLRWCVAPLMVGLCCVAMFGVALRCGVLCVVLVCGPSRGGACCVGVWPPAWWGCAALCFVVSRRGAVCCVVSCCVASWCVAPLVVGHTAPVCGPPHGRAWCVGLRVMCCLALCCV